MSRLTLQQLRVLAAVLEHRSFTQGAKAVFMTQSAASQHVRSLERALGTPLVDRVGGDVLPTRAGEGLWRYARHMLRLADDAERFVEAVREGHAGRLALGAAGSAVYLVPALVSAFRAAHPDVVMRLQVLSRTALRDAVVAGTVDAGLLSGPVRDSALVAQEACPDLLVLIAPPQSPLLPAAVLSPLPFERLAGQELIAPAESSLGWQVVERCAAASGVALHPSLRLDTTEAIKKAVEAGLGVAFVSAWAVERELALGTLRHVPVDVRGLPGLRRRFDLIRHAERHVDPALEAFWRLVPECLAQQVPALARRAPGETDPPAHLTTARVA